MNMEPSDYHAKQVATWIEQRANGLTCEELVPLFGLAIQTIRNRTLATLSAVALNAILNRVVYQSQQKYPMLSAMKVRSDGISVDEILRQASRVEPAEVIEAFRFFLIELLTLLENLTAGILTQPIYRELFKITADSEEE